MEVPGKTGGGAKIMEKRKYYKTPLKARVQDGVVLCPNHWKKVARITPEGIELWCKHENGHPVLLTFRDIIEEVQRPRER